MIVAQKFYCLKCDISKYFDSVDHEILLECSIEKSTMKIFYGFTRDNQEQLKRDTNRQSYESVIRECLSERT